MSIDWHFPALALPTLEDGMQRFVLLDGAQCEQPLRLLRSLPWAPLPLFDGLLADGTDDASVYLARLPREADIERLLQRARAQARSPGMLSVIDSALPAEALQQRLQRRLDARYPNGKAFLARFFDARVLPWWVQVLDEAQCRAFLTLGERWWYLRHDLQWAHLDLHDAAQDPHDPPWVLEAPQRRALIDASYPYTLIDHFQLSDPELLARLPRARWYAFLRRAVATAAAAGIEDSRRVVMVAAWALLAGTDLGEDPAWQQRLQDFASGRRSAADVGDEVWPLEESWD
ncbi:DUF4123 domain-containing protein [Stenotrophomonas sp. RAC2]|uniref:DUF4123 domain-containing protein n=1 Tax=Stenotrophomonas sp. RAC2 TaxID=3064902 RepID=UPI0027275841|nr:DUF4123 domain-containing protein [Stenotrophomonas sp. RAC2]MDV9040672.1 DUF4123 domain-containing protein [Stenotrophomonas sp. RAC2]